MKTELNPDALYWAQFNRFEFRMTGQAVIDCSHSGACDSDVAHWAPRVAEQVQKDNFRRKPTPAKIRAELAEYGGWSDEELQDDARNWERIIWCAAHNIREDDAPDCSEPLKD